MQQIFEVFCYSSKNRKQILANKNEQFYNPSIKKVMISVAGDTNQLYKGGILPRHVFTELKKYFYKNHSDIKDEDFLTTKYGLWIDFRSSQENALHGSGKKIKGDEIILQIEKVAEQAQGLLDCYVFLFQDVLGRNYRCQNSQHYHLILTLLISRESHMGIDMLC